MSNDCILSLFHNVGCVVVHSIWSQSGVLSANNVNPLLEVDVVDFAGSCVVHITGIWHDGPDCYFDIRAAYWTFL